jgi:hypothetical protein
MCLMCTLNGVTSNVKTMKGFLKFRVSKEQNVTYFEVMYHVSYLFLDTVSHCILNNVNRSLFRNAVPTLVACR